MHIFAQYCTPPPTTDTSDHHGLTHSNSHLGQTLLVPPPGAYLTDVALDQWATDTNGAPFSEDTKEELKDLDCTNDGHLTCVAQVAFLETVELKCVQAHRILANISAADRE